MKTLLLLALALIPLTCAAATTADSARTKPLDVLARQLLGESGAIMIDLDRPRFEGILEPIVFYSHATVTGSQFGLCASDWVKVGFDEAGAVNNLSAETRYGVAGDTYRAPGKWTYDESEKLCSAVKSTRKYFPAPDAIAAQQVVWYVDAIAGKGPHSKQGFEFSCTGACNAGRDELTWLVLEEIDAVRAIDCTNSTLERPACFEITVGKNEVGLFPKKFRVHGSTYGNVVVVSAVAVDVGSTLE